MVKLEYINNNYNKTNKGQLSEKLVGISQWNTWPWTNIISSEILSFLTRFFTQ